ncbi:MAG: HAD-IIB family hydrolase [Pseudomonadota bacterium]
MHATPPLMVFSDLDGTLLDHETYDWSPASEALAALKTCGAGLVLASSKTSVEIGGLRGELGVSDWPAIVENGAGILPPHTREVADRSRYMALREVLDGLPEELRAPFTGFGDATAEEVASMTGLSRDGATAAKLRAFSEPGLWEGSEDRKADFIEALKAKGVTAQQGGRFLTLSFGQNKADRVKDLMSAYRPAHTVALGDAPNDAEMLETAEFGVIIPNPHGKTLAPLLGEETGRIIRATAPGPSGWNSAILELVSRLGLAQNGKQ